MLDDESTIQIEYQGERISVKVRQSARAKRLQLRIHQGKAILIVPQRAPSIADIQGFLIGQKNWIHRQLSKQAHLALMNPLKWPKIFIQTDTFPLLGQQTPVYINVQGPSRSCQISLKGQEIHIQRGTSVTEESLKKHIERFYRGLARERALIKATEFGCQLGLTPSTINIRQQSARWGSCSAQGALSINWILMLAPEHVFDYVIAHEVSHLRYASHGPRFWQTVERIYPIYEQAEQWLNEYGPWLQPIRKKDD